MAAAVDSAAVARLVAGKGEKMTRLTQTEKQKISEAIREAEASSSGELVAVIAEASDDYLYIPILWAAVIALALPGFWVLINHGWEIFSYKLYVIQVLTFIGLALLFRWPPLKMRLIPKNVKHRRASALARQEFLTLGLHSTHNRAAILIFVSVAEHYVEIIADQGINEKVNNGEWQQIVDNFIQQVKAEQFAQGFLNAIQRCKEILEQHFPPGTGGEDELPNHLIELYSDHP